MITKIIIPLILIPVLSIFISVIYKEKINNYKWDETEISGLIAIAFGLGYFTCFILFGIN
jgi:hypothetical protein